MEMSNIYDEIYSYADYLDISISVQEIAQFINENKYDEEKIQVIHDFLKYLRDERHNHKVEMLTTMSRIPSKSPKTFSNFDFERIGGKNVEELKSLSTLSALHARKNIALIGPPGVGKTHLAMAFGRECYLKENKAYFLKATELNNKFTEARKTGREENVIKTLVNPSCLIIDEIGRCVFDKVNTRMFFDVIDRRSTKESASNIIFTSNKSPDKWGEFFSEDDTLLCALDRIFDDAMVFMIKGSSYRGHDCKRYSVTAGAAVPGAAVPGETK